MKKRIYVCHTYYHVFISILKEFKLGEGSGATMVLSYLCTEFDGLKERLMATGIFDEVIEFYEKPFEYFPELLELKKNRGNIVSNMFQRIKFTKKFADCLEPFVPVNFKEYEDIYVFCDADPIGNYLNQRKTYYHCVEDGLDYLSYFIEAEVDNRSFYWLKKFMSMKLNLIFIRDGYSKYCIDMEVNNISVLNDSFYKYKEVPRAQLMENLTKEQKEKMIQAFVPDPKRLIGVMAAADEGQKTTLLLTEPLCSFEVRERMFKDLWEEYSADSMCFIKPHPLDTFDYSTIFPKEQIFERKVPMEVFRYFDETKFSRVVGVLTPLVACDFAEEKIALEFDWLDKYEDPAVHRKGEGKAKEECAN